MTRLQSWCQALGTLAILSGLIYLTIWGWRTGERPSVGQVGTVGKAMPGLPALASGRAIPTLTPLPIPDSPRLSVKGAEIMAENQSAVTLIGATRPSLEYLCGGDGHFRPTDFAAMRSWGMNVVRFTLSSEFWADPGATCANYRLTVQNAVLAAESQGLYVILTLQWNAPLDTTEDRLHGGDQCPMPDNQKDVAFWQDVASRYRNDKHVIFDLFGEPHDVSWYTWYNGGTISGGCYVILQHGSQIENGTYTAIGMHALSTLVHTLAPETLLMVSGLDWGYDLSHVTAYPLGTTNVVYDTHPFDYGEKQPIYWDRSFGSLAKHTAVIAGEFGSYDCQTTYSASLIAYLNLHHISWLAWAWNPSSCSGPTIIANWYGQPTEPYGAYIYAQMISASKGHG